MCVATAMLISAFFLCIHLTYLPVGASPCCCELITRVACIPVLLCTYYSCSLHTRATVNLSFLSAVQDKCRKSVAINRVDRTDDSVLHWGTTEDALG
jgi:hypothetical protein